jgi:SAM-dependent methyltransferase
VLRNAFPDARVTGIEISPKAVDEARRAHPGVEFEGFDGARAPLSDASADLVFSYHVLEHVLDLSETVADMTRLVRPGGYVVAILPCANRASIEELATRLVVNGVERSSTGELRFFYDDPGHLRRPTSKQLAAQFAEHECELAGEFYSRHLAALNYVRTAVARQVFDPGRARTRPAAVVLALLRASFLCTGALLTAHQIGPRRLARMLRTRSGAGRLAVLGALLAQPIVLPVGHVLESTLPRWEWRRTSRKGRGGAAQFLVFRKPER